MADTEMVLYSDGGTIYSQPLRDVGGGLYSIFPLDKATLAMTTIEYDHHEIHSGSHYFMAGTVTLDSATSDFTDFCVITPDTTKWAHMTFALDAVGQFSFAVYEDAVFDTDGAAATAFNNNRNSANTSGLEITTGASNVSIVSSDGVTAIFGPVTYGKDGNVTQVTGGVLGRGREIVLKQNTKYIFRIDSATAANAINYYAEWYEHTDKST